MSSGISDLLPPLCYSTPLVASGSFLTDKLIAGQYSALAIMVAADTNTSVNIQFSGNGVDWDANVFRTFDAGVPGVENTVIQSKWIRILISNMDPTSQSYLRVWTYGNLDNTALTATLAPINNIAPSVNVDNLPLSESTLLVEAPQTVAAYDGYSLDQVTLPPPHNVIYDPTGTNTNLLQGNKVGAGGDLWCLTGENTDGSPDPNLAVTAGGRTLLSLQGCPAGGWISFYSKRMSAARNAGKIIFEGSAWWPLASGTPTRSALLLGIVSGDSLSNHFKDFGADPFVAFGTYYTQPSDRYALQVIYSDGFNNYYVKEQRDWNLDKADGSGNLPPLDAHTGMYTYRILVDHLGTGLITWQIQSPSSGSYVSVNKMIGNPASPNSPLFTSRGFRAAVFGAQVAGSANKDIYFGNISLMQSASGLTNLPVTTTVHRVSGPAVNSGSPVKAKVYYMPLIWGSNRNRTNVTVTRIIASCNFNDKPPLLQQIFLRVLRVHKEELLPAIPPPNFFGVDSAVTPIQFDVNATGFTSQFNNTSHVILEEPLSHKEETVKRSKILLDANSPGTSFNLNDWTLSADDVLYFEYQCVNYTIGTYHPSFTVHFSTGL